ncbi:multidrug effflux MFS transporter [Rhodoferax sp. PAMC 29310]|uniref:multidrug effflux MFS transporter n=1 Tax=Rhodoferax sp. PAMC 29310 TaxID=2822760 RepID=UPI001B345409|nr:multidrug effflux MFS transporter [Rhodoferax sp. PAMC 29310]
MQDSLLIVVLAMLSMVGPIGIDTYLPSLPAIGSTFRASAAAVQQTLSIYILCMAVMMLFFGTLSDSFGRRRVLVVAMAVFTVTSFAAAWAPTLGALVVLRALQGLASGAGGIVGRAMVQDHFKGHDAQRATAVVMMVFGVAPALAPIIGGWMQTTWGWRSTFVFMGGFSALMWLICVRFLPETLPPAKRSPFVWGPIGRNYLRCVRDRQFVLLSLSLAFVFGGVALYVGSAAAFVMTILHQSETAFGWLFVPMIGGMVMGSGVSGRLAHRVDPGRLIGVGFAVMVVAVAANLIYTAVWVARVPFAVMPIFVYTFGLALAMPGLSVRALARFPSMTGLAASMQGFIQMFLFAMISGLVAPLLFDSAFKLAAAHGVTVLVGLALWALAIRGGQTLDNAMMLQGRVDS